METLQVYKVKVSQTRRDGTFKCLCCGTEISPDDLTETNYVIDEIKLKKDNLQEIVIHCKKCLSQIHLSGFDEVYSKLNQPNKQNVGAAYISHI